MRICSISVSFPLQKRKRKRRRRPLKPPPVKEPTQVKATSHPFPTSSSSFRGINIVLEERRFSPWNILPVSIAPCRSSTAHALLVLCIKRSSDKGKHTRL